MKRIGILGGTFDPIHFGHIRPALAVKRVLELEKVWLMPNHIPPHKNNNVTATEHRLNMVKLVCDEYEEFELCDIEIKRDKPSYTVTTLEKLTTRFSGVQFTFLMGMDSLLSLNKWYQWQRLFDLCDIAVSHRPGYQVPSGCNMAPVYRKHLTSSDQVNKASHGRIFDIEIEPQPISSTNIRHLLNSKQLDHLSMPEAVIDYIYRHQLYH